MNRDEVIQYLRNFINRDDISENVIEEYGIINGWSYSFRNFNSKKIFQIQIGPVKNRGFVLQEYHIENRWNNATERNYVTQILNSFKDNLRNDNIIIDEDEYQGFPGIFIEQLTDDDIRNRFHHHLTNLINGLLDF